MQTQELPLLLTLAGVMGVLGWERLRGNVYIKEGEVESISNKQASMSRREKAPSAPRQATRTEEGGRTGRTRGDGVGGGGGACSWLHTCQMATRGFLAGR